MKLQIELCHPLHNGGAGDVASTFDVDKGPLAIPAVLAIGNKGSGGVLIISGYQHQVDEYDAWLEDQLKKKNPEVMAELERIFVAAQTNGAILNTIWVASWTHADAIKRKIMELAGLIKWENGRWIDLTVKEEDNVQVAKEAVQATPGPANPYKQ